MRRSCFVCLFLAGSFLLANPAIAWAGSGSAEQEAPGKARRHLAPYEPSLAFPFGRWNPEAPPEVKQFDFMVGEFDCTDRKRERDGTWKEMKTVWNARYFMNGYAIIDAHWKEGFSTSNLRFFDAESGQWKITWFKMPPYGSSAGWVGKKAGENMVVEASFENEQGETILNRLTFYDITGDAYEWKAEQFRNGQLRFGGPYWRISCRRRR